MDPYENLANAIIISAARDYRRTLKRLRHRPNAALWLYEKKSIEDFFFSEYFSALTTADPEKIITRIQLEEDYI